MLSNGVILPKANKKVISKDSAKNLLATKSKRLKKQKTTKRYDKKQLKL